MNRSEAQKKYRKEHPYSKSRKEQISRALKKYYINNPQAKENISKRNSGSRLGSLHSGWKGENAGYTSKHDWIRKHYGNANECEICGRKSKKDKSDIHAFHWANISQKYKRSRRDFRKMCASCHRKSHTGNYCKRGHPFFGKNLYIRKDRPNSRNCRECIRLASLRSKSRLS